MEYNTSRKRMAFPEYGRNIQLLIDYAQTIEDTERQDVVVQSIITIMGNMNPHLRDVADFKHKLWDHLAIMSDFTLPKNSPYAPPSREQLHTKPSKVDYAGGELKHRHFGRIIETLIQKAETIEDPVRKHNLIKTITNHMKKSYILWNKENVSDEVIFDALKDISNGKLEVKDTNFKLVDCEDFITKTNPKNKQKQGNQNQNQGSKKHK